MDCDLCGNDVDYDLLPICLCRDCYERGEPRTVTVKQCWVILDENKQFVAVMDDNGPLNQACVDRGWTQVEGVIRYTVP